MDANDFHLLHDCFTQKNVNDPLFADFLHVWLPKKVHYLASQEAGSMGVKLTYGDKEDLKLIVLRVILKRIDEIPSGVQFRSWICTAVRLQAKNLTRKKQRQKEILVDMTEDSNVIARQIEKNWLTDSFSEQQLEKLEEHLSALSYGNAAPFRLKYEEGYSSKEIAHMLGITVEKVDQRNFRTRKKLEESLKKYFPQFQ